MKIILKILGVVVVLVIIMIIAIISMTKSWVNPDDNFAEINLESIEDGFYQGEYDVTPLKAIVTVHIENNKIIDIIIDEHEHGRGSKGEEIVAEIINKQSLQVDAITGATHSSNAIRKAIEDALNK
ncbi:Uncharacterized protein, contains FMN-binding domain [Natronincola peptidivorans]|uniref:Uncharacterized protein, contains FMN-binding domain n=1 Tax=Natronincola peptidivorans TaxID=426128 RepID=A0A1I0CDA3_9FIRM|nr:FMN-binding protein [Natronincola peptidivorans]SET16991.1 Uncharacterized protein, contains FMN-binding domain [Natronincola peptidivorans]